MTRGMQQRHWWHWPVITVLTALTVYGLVLIMSHSAAGPDATSLLHKPS